MSSAEEFHSSRQLETIGRLSEAVAHDINNLLSGVLGYSELLAEEAGAESLKPLIQEIHHAGERIAQLTHLLLLYRNNEYQPQVLDISNVILDLKKYIPCILGPKKDFSTVLQSGLWPIETDSTQIKRLLFSLAAAARDILPATGQFTIEASTVTSADVSWDGIPLDHGRYIRIAAVASVQDPLVLNRPEETTIMNGISRTAEICRAHMQCASSDKEFSIRIYLPASA